jgi:hypothetical protein
MNQDTGTRRTEKTILKPAPGAHGDHDGIFGIRDRRSFRGPSCRRPLYLLPELRLTTYVCGSHSGKIVPPLDSSALMSLTNAPILSRNAVAPGK